MKTVIVHSCFAAVEPVSIGSGPLTSRRIFHLNMNRDCKCHQRERVSFRERDRMLNDGEALVIVERSERVENCLLPEWRQVVLVHKQKGPPWVQPIRFTDIERAYGFEGSFYQQRRIEVYGLLTQMVMIELGASPALATPLTTPFSPLRPIFDGNESTPKELSLKAQRAIPGDRFLAEALVEAHQGERGAT